MCSAFVWGWWASELLISRIPSSSVPGWTEPLCSKLDLVTQNRELAWGRLQGRAAKIQSEQERGTEPISCPAPLSLTVHLGPALPDWGPVYRGPMLWLTACIHIYINYNKLDFVKSNDRRANGDKAMPPLRLLTHSWCKKTNSKC